MSSEDDARPPSVPEGWQPDPDVPSQERWWTGTEWGPQTRPAPGTGAAGDDVSTSSRPADPDPEGLTQEQKRAKEVKDGKTGCLILIVLAILLGIFFAMCGDSSEGGGSGSGGGSGGGIRVDTATDTEAFVMCQQFVKDRLKSPSTAGFPLMYEATVTGGPKSWNVLSHVDSENGFGAQIRTRFTCSITYEGGDEWRLTSLTFDE